LVCPKSRRVTSAHNARRVPHSPAFHRLHPVCCGAKFNPR
jgi:hypothetical protein